MRDAIWSRTLPAASRAALLASDPVPATADVVVVGAGLVGLCAALSLRRRQAGDIVVVDRGAVAGESTGASAGGLWPSHECLDLGPAAVVARAADLHRDLRERFPCDYAPSGLLELVEAGKVDEARSRAERTRRAGFEARLIDGAELAEREPGLRHAGAALHFPQDGSLHPLKLAAAIARWLRANGVRICLGAAVERLERAGPAIRTAAGRTSASAVVLAAGAWTPLLTRLLGWEPPIRPVRGTLVATGARPPGAIRTVVMGRKYYFWQLARGPLAGGGSEEDLGFREGVDDRIVADIRREFAALFPGLGELRFACRWSGFRPFCEGAQPVIGRVPGERGIYVCAGHFRRGILLAPLSGELVADELLAGQVWEPAKRFRPERFPRAGLD